MVRQETKKQKMAQDKGRATSVESRGDPSVAEVSQQHHTWALQLELDRSHGIAIPWNSSIREFQRGNSSYIAEALEQPLLLLKDMAALRHMRQLSGMFLRQGSKKRERPKSPLGFFLSVYW